MEVRPAARAGLVHRKQHKKLLMSDDATRDIKWLRPVTGVDLP